jgi:CRISPR-associated protein Csb2
VAVDQTLDQLLRNHLAKTSRVSGRSYTQPPALQAFKRVSYRKSGDTPHKPHTLFYCGDGDYPRQIFAQEDITQVASMVRHVAYTRAKFDAGVNFPGGVDAYVAGHVPDARKHFPRFAYLPLPSIGHAHADGKVRRVMIFGSAENEQPYVDWAELRLLGAALVGERSGKTVAVLERPLATDSVAQRYVKEAKSWTTVTPVILPGFDEGKYAKALGLMEKAIVHAGFALDAVADITLRKAPYWPGSQHPAEYFRPKHLRHHAAWHAHIRFCNPVAGPIAIGSGRFSGLGLFAGEAD